MEILNKECIHILVYKLRLETDNLDNWIALNNLSQIFTFLKLQFKHVKICN